MTETRLSRTVLEWQVSTSLDACAGIWRALQEDAVLTAFQRYEWLSDWMASIGTREGAKPAIAVGMADGAARILFPLTIDRGFGARRLSWLAADWCDVCMPLIARDLADDLTEADAAIIVDALPGIVGGADYVHLVRQPMTLGGWSNPFAAYEAEAYSSNAHAVTLGSDWDAFYRSLRSSKTRRRLREKQRHLENAGDLQFRRLTASDDIRNAVSRLLDWKVAQITAKGWFNPFTDRSADAFLSRTLSRAPEFGRFYSLEIDDEMIAGAIVLAERGTFTIFQMAYGLGPHARYSPGYLLTNMMMEAAIEEGFGVFDFSLGDEAYKRGICDLHTPLTQHSRAVTAAGLLPHGYDAAKIRAKRYVKSSDRLSATVFGLNRAAHRLGFFTGGRKAAPSTSSPAALDPIPTAEKPL